jgi:hypothetical protein
VRQGGLRDRSLSRNMASGCWAALDLPAPTAKVRSPPIAALIYLSGETIVFPVRATNRAMLPVLWRTRQVEDTKPTPLPFYDM